MAHRHGGAEQWGLARPLAGEPRAAPSLARPRADPGAAWHPGWSRCPGGRGRLGPHTTGSSRPALSAPGEGAARFQFTYPQRVVWGSLGAGRGSADSRAGLERRSAWAASPVGPPVPTGPQHSTGALHAPPPPAPPPPPRLSALSSASSLPASAISKAPSLGCPRPRPPPS